MPVKWRPHRGGLAEAMEEAREIANMADLRAILGTGYLSSHLDLNSIEIKPYGYGRDMPELLKDHPWLATLPDPRIGWDDTWIVTAVWSDGKRTPVGFTDGPVPE